MGSTTCFDCGQLSQFQIDDGLEVLHVPEPAGSALRGLDDRVHALEPGVGEAVVEVVQDLGPVVPERSGQHLHRLDVRVHDPADEGVQLLRCLLLLRAFVHVPQRLDHHVRPSCLEPLLGQLALALRLPLRQVLLAFEPDVPRVPEQPPLLGRLPRLPGPHQVELPVRRLHHVEPVDHPRRVGEPGGDARREGWGHVAGHGPDAPTVAAVRLQVVREALHGRRVAAFRAEHGALPVEVDEHGEVVVPALAGRLVDAYARDIGEVDVEAGAPDEAVEHPPERRVAGAEHLGRALHWHPRHDHHEGVRLEQRGEMGRVVARPGDGRGERSAVRAVDAGYLAVDDGLVLPDVQVAPFAVPGVVDPVGHAASRAGNRMPGCALDVDVELVIAVILPELDVRHGPLGTEVHGLLNQRRQHCRFPPHRYPR